jgi:hypothetical protein
MTDTTETQRRLEQDEASKFLTDRGYRTAPATLNKLRHTGGGPVYEKFGRRPLYTEEALLDWIEECTSKPRRSTSDDGSHPKDAA